MKTLQDSINLIQDWRKTFGLRTYGNGTDEEIKLANKLIAEEFKEWIDAIVENDKVEQLDALADLAFVLVQKANVTIGELNAPESPFWLESFESSVIFHMVELGNDDEFIELIGELENKVHDFGVNFYDLIKEVYDSNMSKLCKDFPTAIKTQNDYLEKGIEVYFDRCPTDDTKYIIYRKSDAKVLKSIDFVKPNIAKFLK